MGIGDLFKLEKLKIYAYKDQDRHAEIGYFEAMFNPETINQRFEIHYGLNQGMDSSGKSLNFSKSKPADLDLKLILDGTGTTQMGVMQLMSSPEDAVAARVKKFLELCYDLNGDIHEPNYLSVKWAGLFETFNCRLGSVDIHYTHFDRDGTPLRAELEMKLISDISVKDLQKKENKKSPDLTHSRVVIAGDTLPLLCKEVYGSSAHYLWVADVNQLDEIRQLTPGQRLSFPPLTNKVS